jgi:hypothetical protein
MATSHCPQHHKLRLVEFSIRHGKETRQAWACPVPACSFVTVVPPVRALNPQRRLGVIARERVQIVLKENEAGVSRRIEDRFAVRGYEVMVTSEQRKKVECALYKGGQRTGGCGLWFFPHDGSGVDKGIPDIFVRDPRRYPPYVWIGIEVKGPTTPISDEQRAYGARLGYVIARGDEEAWNAVMWAESILETAIATWRHDCAEILFARQSALDGTPDWTQERLAWLRQERETIVRVGRQTLAVLDAEIKQLEGRS